MIDPKSEIAFWSGIMRDHAMFHVNALAPSEAYYVQISLQYMNFFQQILNRIENGENIADILPALINGLNSFIEYKKILLSRLLTCQLQINLPPSLINHQINEAMEFKGILSMPVQSKIDTPLEMVNRLKIWLVDSVGHAAGLAAFLDPAEALLADETLKFKESFNKLLTKASELEMMLTKTYLKDGALLYLAEETTDMMEKFICFLDKVKKLRMSCKVLGLGTLSPLIPDHFIREHRYFIGRIKSYNYYD